MQLSRVLEEVIPARRDARPLVSWPGASVRRYRNRLYLLPEILMEAPATIEVSSRHTPLGPGLGTLRFVHDAPHGLAERFWQAGVQVRFRRGGERFQAEGQSHTRKLKKLLQEEGVVPWMRDRLPLVYADDELVAVGDLWIAAKAVAEPGIAIRWDERPALH